MNIEDNRQTGGVPLSDIKPGGCFETPKHHEGTGAIYIVVRNDGQCPRNNINCLLLTGSRQGDLVQFHDSSIVTPLNTKLVIDP